MKEISYLNPICEVFVEDSGNYENCSSVSALITDYENNNNIIIKKYYNENIKLIEKIYRSIKFEDSKEVSFLINKAKNKLKILDILSEFDKIKNNYSPLNKTRISCENINIGSDFILDIECSAYSGEWDDEILGYSGNNKGKDIVKGSSISVASSFINFIEKLENPKFFILDKPKQFTFIEIVNNEGYVKKTNFKLKLKYKNNNILLQK
ncbi:MAG: hypothetical protein Q9M97_02105 [Candidatus Gracilibacteria bacterium]|nr:hypothetical protein [Candidatus Gracilibacteria bacterium]